MSYPDYRRNTAPQRGDPVGPSIEELIRRKKNFDKRFEAVGFQEKKFKQSWIRKYPRTFVIGFTATYLSLYFGQFVYHTFIRDPTEEEAFLYNIKQKRYADIGFIDKPKYYGDFVPNRDIPKTE